MKPTESEHVSRRALLLIDFQVDFLTREGRLPVELTQVEPVLTSARRAVEEAQKIGDQVIRIGNEFRPTDRLMNFFRRNASIAGSPGAKWDPRLPIEGSAYFPKWAASAFVNPELDGYLKSGGVQEVALCGLQAKACVAATALEALRRGYRTSVLADATACLSDQSRRRALRRLEAKGVQIVGASLFNADGRDR